jgi:hypothetical protein
MFDKFFDGFCPECLLKDRRVEMILNGGDYFECPDCHLQVSTESLRAGMVTILRKRGKGDIRQTRASSVCIGVFLARESRGDKSESFIIDTEESMRKYLREEVES